MFCGHLRAEPTTFEVNKKAPSIIYEVPKTEYETWFSLDDPSKNCNLPTITYNLYSDSLCTTQQNVPGRIEIISTVLTFMGGATEVGVPE